jgi:predicted metal-dependent peptidase
MTDDRRSFQSAPRRGYTEAVLTGTHKRQWEETLAAVNWVAPGFAHILYTMLNRRGDTQVALFTEEIKYIAATDGLQLLFKPSEFFKLTLMRRVFIVLHEIMHNVFDHCYQGYRLRKQGTLTWEGRVLPYVHEPANIIQDLIINDGLIESRIGEWPGFGWHDPKVATHHDSWVEVYFRVVKVMPSPRGRGGAGKGQGKGDMSVTLPGVNPDGSPVTQPGKPKGRRTDAKAEPADPQGDQADQGTPERAQGSWDEHLDPGMSEGTKPAQAPERSPQEWQQAVAAALVVSRAQGKLPAALEHMFKSVLEPKVDWTEHIHGIIARKVGSGGYDWHKPDRRLLVRDIVIPGRSGHGVDCVVLGADSSGSIYADPDVLDIWLGECKGILEELRPRKMFLVWCDAKIQRVDELTDPGDLDWVRMKGAKGGGGTSFVPVFEWINNEHLQPDCLLYLTDMMGTFPKSAPRYPVIWGSIFPDKRAPFGDVVHVPYNPR